jgi:hypothetical protein
MENARSHHFGPCYGGKLAASQDNDPTRSSTGSGVTLGDTEGGQEPVEQSAPAPADCLLTAGPLS